MKKFNMIQTETLFCFRKYSFDKFVLPLTPPPTKGDEYHTGKPPLESSHLINPDEQVNPIKFSESIIKLKMMLILSMCVACLSIKLIALVASTIVEYLLYQGERMVA